MRTAEFRHDRRCGCRSADLPPDYRSDAGPEVARGRRRMSRRMSRRMRQRFRDRSAEFADRGARRSGRRWSGERRRVRLSTGTVKNAHGDVLPLREGSRRRDRGRVAARRESRSDQGDGCEDRGIWCPHGQCRWFQGREAVPGSSSRGFARAATRFDDHDPAARRAGALRLLHRRSRLEHRYRRSSSGRRNRCDARPRCRRLRTPCESLRTAALRQAVLHRTTATLLARARESCRLAAEHGNIRQANGHEAGQMKQQRQGRQKADAEMIRQRRKKAFHGSASAWCVSVGRRALYHSQRRAHRSTRVACPLGDRQAGPTTNRPEGDRFAA